MTSHQPTGSPIAAPTPAANLRGFALAAREVALAPSRRWRMRGRMRAGTAPLNVPFYHRVADSHPNDWTIRCDQFRRHVEYCAQHFQRVSLLELQRRVACGRNETPTITFTFDDGYAENIDNAIPVLLEYDMPTTYFVTVGNVVNQIPFPHDMEAGRPLPVNSVEHLRQMSDAGIDIGLHTLTHPDFSKFTEREAVRREIIDAKCQLEDIVGRVVRTFAVPYGLPQQLTRLVFEVSREAGLSGVCSAFGAYNVPRRDAFHIRRFHGDSEFSRLVNWLSFDARKLRDEPVIDTAQPSDDSDTKVDMKTGPTVAVGATPSPDSTTSPDSPMSFSR